MTVHEAGTLVQGLGCRRAAVPWPVFCGGAWRE